MNNDISTFKDSDSELKLNRISSNKDLRDEIKALQRAVCRLTYLTAKILDLEERRYAALRERGGS